MPEVSPFSLLAQVYDAIMDDVDYAFWTDFMLSEVAKRGLEPQKVLDMGCGTGNITEYLLAKGLDVVGLDGSKDMLKVAQAKLPEVIFVEADFRDFALEQEFDLVVSVFDSLNNLLSPADFERCLKRMYAHLRFGGMVMFDVNTSKGLKDLWEDNRMEGWAGDVYYRWLHSYDEGEKVARVDAYCERHGQGFSETHYERAYDIAELEVLLKNAGFWNIAIIAEPLGEAADEYDERVWALAKK